MAASAWRNAAGARRESMQQPAIQPLCGCHLWRITWPSAESRKPAVSMAMSVAAGGGWLAAWRSVAWPMKILSFWRLQPGNGSVPALSAISIM